jgi:hypothetical protein
VISPRPARLPHVSERVPLAIVVMEVDGSEVRVGPVEGGLRCDLGLVDDLLKFVLAAGRLGWAVRLREVDPDLRELIDLLGMSERVGLGHDTGPPGAGIARRDARALGLDALG